MSPRAIRSRSSSRAARRRASWTVKNAADTCPGQPTPRSWSVAEGSAGGTVDGDAVYTAPNAAGTYHVTATSHADPSKSATAEVTVTATPLAVSITIAPDQGVAARAQMARALGASRSAAGTRGRGPSGGGG